MGQFVSPPRCRPAATTKEPRFEGCRQARLPLANSEAPPARSRAGRGRTPQSRRECGAESPQCSLFQGSKERKIKYVVQYWRRTKTNTGTTQRHSEGDFFSSPHLYAPQKRRKHDTLLDFATFWRQRKILTQKVPQKGPLKNNFDKKLTKKTPQVALLQKRRKI